MRPTDNFRRQHQELSALAEEVERTLDTADAQQLRRLLGRLSGKLQMHAAMEENALYPRLLHHEREGVRAVAVRLRDEVGGVYSLVGAFVVRWHQAGAIEQDRAGFAKDVGSVFRVLRQRVEVEERELYPMADVVS
jgi:hypothetical protein